VGTGNFGQLMAIVEYFRVILFVEIPIIMVFSLFLQDFFLMSDLV